VQSNSWAIGQKRSTFKGKGNSIKEEEADDLQAYKRPD